MALRTSDVREATIPSRTLDDRLELHIDDEVAITPGAARVLARIVRQHLDDKDATAGLACHTPAPN